MFIYVEKLNYINDYPKRGSDRNDNNFHRNISVIDI